jgi:hypothetical protein
MLLHSLQRADIKGLSLKLFNKVAQGRSIPDERDMGGVQNDLSYYRDGSVRGVVQN